MNAFGYIYDVNPFTWLCLSFILILAVFFRFGRVWSLRNFDLLLLLLVSPALLFVTSSSGAPQSSEATGGEQTSAMTVETASTAEQSDPILTQASPEQSGSQADVNEPQSTMVADAADAENAGNGESDAFVTEDGANDRSRRAYYLLFAITGAFLIRLLVDPLLRRRPHLVPNLNAQGSAFLSAAAILLLTLQAFEALPAHATSEALQSAESELNGEETDASEAATGPTVRWLFTAAMQALFENYAPRAIAIFSHLLVFLGLVFVGRNLFGDVQLGLGMATLYLLLPCTAFDVAEVNHVLPAALTLWALVAYRRPMVSGALLGLACGIMFFPVFLIPLWAAFYGRRGIVRFSAALLLIGSVVCTTVALTSTGPDSFFSQITGTIHPEILSLATPESVDGFWLHSHPYYRIPVIVSFFLLLIGLTFWPRRKNVEHLVSASAAVITATQFWYPQQGGVYVLWYLPLLLVAMFRPRLVHLQRTDDALESQAQRSSQVPGPHARGVAKPSERLHLFR